MAVRSLSHANALGRLFAPAIRFGVAWSPQQLTANRMSSFSTLIRPHVTAELERARALSSSGHAALAFQHLERAHVLGQASTVEHVRAHWHMLAWGLRNRSAPEVLGQVLRLAGAATKTAIGLVPRGNTGGANISPFKSLPVPPDLDAILISAATRIK